MNNLEKDVAAARSAAGHNAYQLVEEYGVHDGAQLLRAVARIYVRALAAVIGWPETLALIQQEFAGHYVPPKGQSFRVVSDNGVESNASSSDAS